MQKQEVGTMEPEALYHSMRVLFVLLEDHTQQALHPFGLENAHYATLRWLDEVQGRRLVELYQLALVDKSKMTRIVDSLEAQGLVTRLVDSADRRAQRVVLTAKGAQVRAEAQAAQTAALAMVFHTLGEAEQAQLGQMVARLRDALQPPKR